MIRKTTSATMVAAIVYAAHVFLGSIVMILSVSRDPQGAAEASEERHTTGHGHGSLSCRAHGDGRP